MPTYGPLPPPVITRLLYDEPGAPRHGRFSGYHLERWQRYSDPARGDLTVVTEAFVRLDDGTRIPPGGTLDNVDRTLQNSHLMLESSP